MARQYWPEAAVSFVGVVTFTALADHTWGLMVATSAGAVVMLMLAIRWNISERDAARWWRLGLLVLCNVLIALLTAFWVIADGLIFTRDFGESFSVFLAAHNARDFVTFLLQDMSTDVDPAGHPFLYTHQPSFVARLSSMLFQAFGLGIPANMAFNFMAAVLLLWAMSNELGKLLPWPVVIGGATFATCGYALFHENIVDLTRAPGYFALFGGVATLARDPALRHVWSRIALAAAVSVAAASDFLVCVFVVYVFAGMHLWLSKAVHLSRLLACFVAPCLAFYALYFGTVAVVVGLNFFVVDVLYSYFGRAGQILPALSSLAWIPNLPNSLQEVPRFYQDAGVVLWQRPSQAFDVQSLFVEIARSWGGQAGLVAWGMGITTAVSLVGSVASYRWWWLVTAGGVVLVAVCMAFKLPLLVLLALPMVFLFMLPRLAPDGIFTRLAHGAEAGRRTQNAVVFTAIAAMGVLAVASVFPEYGIRFIIGERRGVPAPLLEMFSFGLLTYIGSRLVRYGLVSRSAAVSTRSVFVGVGITLVVLLVGLVVTTNLGQFRSSPPKAPTYAGVLSTPKYRHEAFVTTSFYGQTWYFTRGWAYMVPNPPLKPFVDYWNLRHLRDWKNTEKYGRPHYFLCDNTPLKGYSVSFTPARPCSVAQSCSCVDVAEYMRDHGYTPVVVEPDFAIIDVRNTQGPLHRSPQ